MDEMMLSVLRVVSLNDLALIWCRVNAGMVSSIADIKTRSAILPNVTFL